MLGQVGVRKSPEGHGTLMGVRGWDLFARLFRESAIFTITTPLLENGRSLMWPWANSPRVVKMHKLKHFFTLAEIMSAFGSVLYFFNWWLWKCFGGCGLGRAFGMFRVMGYGTFRYFLCDVIVPNKCLHQPVHGLQVKISICALTGNNASLLLRLMWIVHCFK